MMSNRNKNSMRQLSLLCILGLSSPCSVASFHVIKAKTSRGSTYEWIEPINNLSSDIISRPIRNLRSFRRKYCGMGLASHNNNQNDEFTKQKIHEEFRSSRIRDRRKMTENISRSRNPQLLSSKGPLKISQTKIEYLEKATQSLLGSKLGTLAEGGKWHQVVSVLMAWSNYSKKHPDAPRQMEALLNILINERQAGNTNVELTIDLYNAVIDGWACSALFQKTSPTQYASQRARLILVRMQESYERNVGIPPDRNSFAIVLHCVCRIEGALIARRILAWMEYLVKSAKNSAAQPLQLDYLMVLDCYGSLNDKNTPLLTEGFIRHMNSIFNSDIHRNRSDELSTSDEYENHEKCLLPNTYCYNILLKSWNRQVALNGGRGGRLAAEQADRILEEMKESGLEHCKPDLITYSSVISAWAASGMKSHAVSRAEALLREIEESPNLDVNVVVLNAVMSAWVKSRNPASVSRTEEILRQMEAFAASVDEYDANTNAKPDLISYNTHLHALSIHSSKNPKYASKAELLLQQLEERYDNGDIDFGPNTFTYNLALEAICRASLSSHDINFIDSAAIKCALILRKLIKRANADPDVYSFNQVLAALSRSSAVRSAKTASELLAYMKESFQSGIFPLAKPNTDSFFYVISAYTRSGGKSSAEKAESLLNEMKQQYELSNDESIKPNRACYNSIIDCWAKSGEGTYGARKAEALLHEMQHMYEIQGDKTMTPTLITFNSVLNAWAKSGTRCCGYKAEQYLKKMWDMYNAGDLNVKPNDFSYNTVINAISKSKNAGKAQKALRILRKMDKQYRAGNKDARPNEITYTAVLNSCAFPAVLDVKTRRKALDTAIFTLKELQDSQYYGQPNQVTYGTFIKACRNLLNDDEDLCRNVIKNAFAECIKDGQVGQMVLNYVPNDIVDEALASYNLQTGVQHIGKRRYTLETLPAEWKSNLRNENEWKSKPFGSKKALISRRRSKRSAS